jgi:hypothetical protein
MEAVVDTDRSPVSFLGRLSPAFERRVVVFAPDQTLLYDNVEWQGAIVVVEQGQIELECLDGSCHCFGRSDVLWLERLPLRALHNRGRTPAVLVAVTRRAAASDKMTS